MADANSNRNSSTRHSGEPNFVQSAMTDENSSTAREIRHVAKLLNSGDVDAVLAIVLAK